MPRDVLPGGSDSPQKRLWMNLLTTCLALGKSRPRTGKHLGTPLGIVELRDDTPRLTCTIGIHPCGQKIETRILTCWTPGEAQVPNAGVSAR